MAPDVNTLPPARSASVDDDTPTDASQRVSSHSLAAAATINAGIQNQESGPSSTSPGSRSRGERVPPPTSHDRQRSAVMMNLNLNDPGLPGPGELQGADPRPTISQTTSPQSIGRSSFSLGTADPHHQRAPSLGELHQELEQEQEAQVNRLLSMIRQQQEQLTQLQQGTGQTRPDSAAAAIDDSTPTSERSLSFPPVSHVPVSVSNPRTRSPAPPGRRGSHGLSRQSSSQSRTHSRGSSPALRPLSGSLSGSGEATEQPWNSLASNRDESVFYQAETQTLTRENQMLKQRIRELERQLNEAGSIAATSSSPSIGSNLNAPPLSQSEVPTSGPTEGGD
ncbi:MAG: hypothetical protein M1837_003832 [Sclerophora amabilis]|nr:MAG: hypothetical protein M1837_003832 [Sclerophora amabilis]